MREQVVQPSPFSSEIKLLLQAAMAIFLITVVIGILNGLDLMEFSRPTLLTHVHAGALGWITLAVFGGCLWLFSEGRPASGWRATSPRWLCFGAIGAIALYLLAFFTTTGLARPLAGILTLLAIAGFFAWMIAQSRHIPLSVPHLGLLLALATLTVGAVLGALIGLQLAGRISFLPVGAFGSHPATLVIGYLILAGMAIIEWHLMPVPALVSADRLGLVQVALPFFGGLTLMAGTLLDIFPLILLNVPFEILGVLLFLWRLGSRVVRLHWLEGSSHRLFGLSAIFLVANVALLTYLIITYAEDFERVPSWLFFALDHSMFLGVMTNALFALVYEASRERRSFWPWADHLLFWGMNIGLLGFILGLLLQSPELKRIFTPIMGTSILLALLTNTIRLQTKPARAKAMAAG